MLKITNHIEEYVSQSRSKNIRKGYRDLIEYIMGLRTHFLNQYPNEYVVGSFYQGYMDMSYFPITPKSLKNEKLKFGIVFNYEKTRFEIWFMGHNKKMHKQYWDFFNGIEWKKYALSTTPQNSVIEHVLVEKPDFSQLNALTEKIEREALTFIHDIREILTK